MKSKKDLDVNVNDKDDDKNAGQDVFYLCPKHIHIISDIRIDTFNTYLKQEMRFLFRIYNFRIEICLNINYLNITE